MFVLISVNFQLLLLTKKLCVIQYLIFDKQVLLVACNV